MSNVVNLATYRARQAVKQKAIESSMLYGTRLSSLQYDELLRLTMEGYEVTRVRLIEGEPLVVMNNDTHLAFIEYDGFTIICEKE